MRQIVFLLILLCAPVSALAQDGPIWVTEPTQAVDPNGNLRYLATPEDLEGLWAGTYWDPCPNREPTTYTVEIKAEGNTITAVHVGAGCMPPGTVRWSGTLQEDGQLILGEATVADSSKKPLYQVPVEIIVMGRNDLFPNTRLSTYRRIDPKAEMKPEERAAPKSLTASGDLEPPAEDAPEIAPPPPPPEKPKGGHIQVQATFSKTGEPVIGYTLYLRRIGNSKIIAQHPMRGGDLGGFTFRDLEPGSYTVRIGEQELPVDQDKALVRIDLLEREETREVSVELDPTEVTVRAHFTAHGPGDSQDKLRFAKVFIEPSEGETQEIHSGESGRIEATLAPAPESYTLRLELRHRFHFEVRSAKGYGGDVVELISRRISVEGTESVTNFELLPDEYNLDKNRMSQAQRDVLRDAAYSYVQLEKAAAFADEELEDLYLYEPLRFQLHEETTEFTYEPESNVVRIADFEGFSSYLSKDAPLNREFHLFGHHLNYQSGLRYRYSLPTGAIPSAATFFNYVLPPGPAFYEGFAIYFAAIVNNNPVYRWQSGEANLETNGFSISDFYDGWGDGPVTELKVASLLWDLTDTTNEPGDDFSLSPNELWSILSKGRVRSARGLYWSLDKEFGTRSTRDYDNDPLTDDVEELFILHGLFNDKDGDGKWRPGENFGEFNYEWD
ncbi:MAG: hypothetical protein ACFB0Z_01695 [Candidatus Phaeomarinobacter sp.]